LADEVRAAEKQHRERVTSVKLNLRTWLAKQEAVVVHLQNELALYKALAGSVGNVALALGPPRPGLPEAAPGTRMVSQADEDEGAHTSLIKPEVVLAALGMGEPGPGRQTT
jgi:hypothetical protein